MNTNHGKPIPVSEAIKSLESLEATKVKMVLERGVKIPAQPRVLEELRKLLTREVFDVRALARTISQDASISAMLFKICASAAYKQHQPFDSVEQILHAVGVRQTYNLVQAITLMSVATVKGSERHVYEAFWSRSQTVAQLAMLIAEDRITVCNIFPDQACLAGLFHDVGIALLMQRFPTYCQEMHLTNAGQWVDVAEEDKKFAADHCAVGYIVARHWGLPDFICDAIRNHHDIRRIGLHESRTMVAILQLAEEIHYRLQRVSSPDWPNNQPEVLEELGVHEDALPELIDIIIERFLAQH